MTASPEPLLERVIKPHDGMDAFRDAVLSCVRDFPQSRSLAWRMLLRDVRAAYRQSVLGYTWMLLPPLANTLIWVFLTQQELVAIDSGDVPFTVFVLTGNILWAAFNGAVMEMLSILHTARGTLSKVNFPHEALVMTAFGKSVLNGLVPALLLIPAIFCYGIECQAAMVLFLPGLVGTLFLGGVMGLIFVPMAALYTDIGRGVQLALRLGFFLTPVIYPMPMSGWSHTLLSCNPVTSVLVSSRSWLLGSGPTMLPEMIIVLLVNGAMFVAALIAYKVAMPHIIERLND
jgi:lipopolysaccharide transport system permease protein